MARRGALAAFGVVALASVVISASVGGQTRAVERHTLASAEGRLLGFYAAALAFSPVGAVASDDRTWPRIDAGLELSYIPRLGAAQRSAGFDKPEASNLAPVFPRPRVRVRLNDGIAIEGSWIPPVRVFRARASLFAGAVSGPVLRAGEIVMAPRLSAVTGRVRGAITCYRGLADASADLAVYYSLVCHARESDDHFEPRQGALEVTAARRGDARLTPFASAGLVRDWARFDIGVRRADGTRDADEPILQLRTVRPFGTGGMSWRVSRRVSFAVEGYYAPRSLVTVRAAARVGVR